MKIVLSADNHLGKVQYGSRAREFDLLKAFYSIVDWCIKNKVTHILCGGDLFDNKTPNTRLLAQLQNIEDEMIECGIHFWYISGNHDECEGIEWLEVITKNRHPDSPGFFNISGSIESLPDGKVVSGIKHKDREDLIKRLNERTRDANIVIIHEAVNEFTNYESSTGLSISDIPNTFDLVLVGDTHVTEILKNGECLVVSPGSTELMDKGESEDKFFLLYDTEEKKAEKIRIDTRPVVRINVDSESAVEDFEKHLANERSPLIYVDVDPKFESTVDSIIKKSKNNEFVRKQKSGKSLDRSREIASTIRQSKSGNTGDILESIFKPDSEEYMLTLKLIDKQTDADLLIKAYLNDVT